MATRYISEDEVFGRKPKPAGPNYISEDEVFGRTKEAYTGPTTFEAKVAKDAKEESSYGVKDFFADVSKQFGGAIAGGTLKIPLGLETGTKGAARSVVSGEALEATPVGKVFSLARSALRLL
jgi:hypothetical protein